MICRGMRGRNNSQLSVVCLFNLEDAIPEEHPIRKVKRLADEALAELQDVLTTMYAAKGRPCVPPERLLLATVLMALYSVRSERLLCERLRYDLLFSWTHAGLVASRRTWPRTRANVGQRSTAEPRVGADTRPAWSSVGSSSRGSVGASLSADSNGVDFVALRRPNDWRTSRARHTTCYASRG